MKHLNQINAALVIIGLGAVFYSLSLTIFNRQDSPVLVISMSEQETNDEFPAVASDPGSPAIPAEARSQRSRPIATGRPANRDANQDSSRRSPLSTAPRQNRTPSSPQLINAPRSDGNPRTVPRTRVLTTPPSTVRGNRNLPNSPAAGRPGMAEGQDQNFRDAVERMRDQGGVPNRTGPAVNPIRPGSAGQNQGRRRQTAPPPARSSMSSQRPPL